MSLCLLNVLGERRRELRVARDLLRTLDLDKRLQLDRVRVRQVDRELLFDGRGHTGPPVFRWARSGPAPAPVRGGLRGRARRLAPAGCCHRQAYDARWRAENPALRPPSGLASFRCRSMAAIS